MNKLTITFNESPDLPPQFPAIAACETVIAAMQTPASGNSGSAEDGNGGLISWKLEKE